VDGAFGLWAAASRDKAPLVAGVAEADSWSVDAHKTLNAPYDNGIVLCRDGAALVSALQSAEAYILYDPDHRDGMMFTTEMSRRARAVELWATLKSLGRGGVEELVDRLCAHAQSFARLAGAAGFRVLNDVVFNQVLVACETPELTRATLRAVQASGECWCGGTTWRGEPVVRVSVCSWATTDEDIARSVAAFARARVQALAGAAGAPAA
jgi:glutamate/tyrosine decarboxylase-like PLP-dependent enzyme